MKNFASPFHHDGDKLSESVAKLMKETPEHLAKEQSILEANSCATGNYMCKAYHARCTYQIIQLII